jgi:RimJ/RimL family protein N-acetyltransferase
VTLRLFPIAPDDDLEALVRTLAPSFGGDEAAPREIVGQTQAMLRTQPRPDPWGSYIAWEAETPVGTCAFKHAPNEAGKVEIAYMTFPPFEGRGHATAMAGQLVEMARASGAKMAVAHTLPEENASNRALRRNGFTFGGEVIDPEDGPVWRWEKRLS